MPSSPLSAASPAASVLAWAAGLSLVAASFGWMGSAPSLRDPISIEAGLSPRERVVVDSVRTAFAGTLAEQEAAFAAVDSLSGREIGRLRRALNRDHVRAARRLGIAPVATDSALAARLDALALQPVTPDSRYYTTRWNVGRLTPDALAALDAIGDRFHQRLAAAGLPTVRFVISSTFRTAEHQDRLRGVNANATRSTSSHEYGTTFDLAYRRYDPVLRGRTLDRVPASLPTLTRLWLASELAATERDRATRWASDYAGLYEAELGRALAELEDEGVLLALREVAQPCFHITVARRQA